MNGAQGHSELADAAAVRGMLRAGLSPRDAFVAVGWGEPGADGVPPGAGPPFAVAARLAHSTGASLAPILDALSAAALADQEAELARETSLAGPRLSARILAWLPAVGLGLAVLVDAGVLATLITPAGLSLLGGAVALTLCGRWWMRRMVAKAQSTPDATGVTLHAVRAALAAGADVASALAAVGNACIPERTLARAGEELRVVALCLARGDAWSAAWESAPRLETLRRALLLPWERGAHAAPMLEAAAQSWALERRRQAQVAASELSVRLTIPLALCLLPAFILVGIVPLLVSVVGGLR